MQDVAQVLSSIIPMVVNLVLTIMMLKMVFGLLREVRV